MIVLMIELRTCFCLFTVDGTSDDLDLPMKKCCSDEDFVNKHKICSMNSVNWARIMVQIAHYFYAFYQVDLFF